MTYFLFSILFAVVIPGAHPPGNAIGAVPEMNSVVTGLVTVAYGNAFVLETDSGPLDLYGTRSYAIKTGDVIVATCRSGKRPIGPPSRILTSVLPLGRGEIPSPVDMPLETILHEQLFLRPVRTTGTVDDIVPDEIDSRYLQVVIRSESATVTLPLSHETLAALNGAERLLHADVELTGCCAKRIPSYRYLYGPVFLPFDAQSIRIIKFATDVFKHPRIPTDDTIAPSEFASLGLRTLAGTVVATWGRNNVLLRSEPHSEVDCHRIELAPGIPHPPVGLQIEVVGQPETDLYHINLSRALYRPLSNEKHLFPEPEFHVISDIVANGLYKPGFFGRTITLRGTVTGQPGTGTPDARLRLSADGTEFAVETGNWSDILSRCAIGCILDISGVCLFETDNWRPNAPLPTIRGLTIIARSPQDIRIVSSPPWWTVGRLAVLLVGLLTILAGVLLWNRILNRLIVRRSRELLREQSARNASELRIGERTRLAVELHDTLSQNLAGVACQVASAQNAVGQDEEKLRKRLTAAERILKSCRTELRQVLSDLRSNALEQDNLKDAIVMVLDDVIGDARLSIRFNVPRTRLLDSTAHAILSIVRELTGNAIRHGGATTVWVAGAMERGQLLFSVKDNGAGFDPATSPGPAQGHFGLDGIRNRINRFGGTFNLDTAPGKGVYAIIRIPLPGHNDKETII